MTRRRADKINTEEIAEEDSDDRAQKLRLTKGRSDFDVTVENTP